MDDERLVILERALVRAVAAERVPRGARRRALSALRLMVLTPPARAVVQKASAPWQDVGWSRTPILKWVFVVLAGAAIGALGGAVVPRLRVAAAALDDRVAASLAPPQTCWEQPMTPGRDPESSQPSSLRAEAAPLAPAAASDSPPVTAEGAGIFVDAPPTTEWSNAITSGSAAPLPRSMSSLRLEIVLLDRTNEALRRGDAEDALAILDDYFALFPHGELLEEAAAAREQAVVASTFSLK